MSSDVNGRLDMTESERRLQRVADELEIRNLIATIYVMADEDPDLTAYSEQFTPDAVWERTDGGVAGIHAGTKLEGREKIVADRQHLRDTGQAGPSSRRRHLITTVTVAFEADDTAIARSKFLLVHGDNPRPVIDSVGDYKDTLRRTDTGWKLCRREYSSLNRFN